MSDGRDLTSELSPTKRALFELLRRKHTLPTDPIPRRRAATPVPLSFGQERLWFLHRLDPDAGAYAVPYAASYRGVLLPAIVDRALAHLVERHETLRTTFAEVEGRPLQHIAPAAAPEVAHVDLSSLAEDRIDGEIAAIARDTFDRPFTLETGPLLRVTHIMRSAERHVLLFAMHHIVSDTASLQQFVREFASCCATFAAGVEPRLPELPIQFADFAVWQREWLAGPVRDAQMQYWTRQLAGLEPIAVPTDRPRPPVQTFRGQVHRFQVPPPVTAGLRQLAQHRQATLFMTLLAGFAAFLHRYTRQRDLAIGSVVANRSRTETERVIGLFANTIVLRVDCSGDPSCDQLVARVRDVVLEAHAHQDLPFEQLVERLQPVRDLSRNPLFQVFFSYQRLAGDEGLVGARALDIPISKTKFDLDCRVRRHDRGAKGRNRVQRRFSSARRASPAWPRISRRCSRRWPRIPRRPYRPCPCSMRPNRRGASPPGPERSVRFPRTPRCPSGSGAPRGLAARGKRWCAVLSGCRTPSSIGARPASPRSCGRAASGLRREWASASSAALA